MTTDAEKAAILLRITADLAQPFCREERMHGGWTMLFQHGQPATQFIPSELAERIGAPLKAGDVVRCATNPRHRWGVAEYVEPLDDGAVLRELGGGPLLAMRNESFYVLRFYPPEILFYGHKRRVYDWARGKAFRRAADDPWATKCGGVEMSDDTLSVWVRPHMWFSERRQKDGPTLYAQPRRIDMPWTSGRGHATSTPTRRPHTGRGCSATSSLRSAERRRQSRSHRTCTSCRTGATSSTSELRAWAATGRRTI